MNFKELYEGTTPKLPGAVKGIKVMTPQQFVAQAGDEKLDELSPQTLASYKKKAGAEASRLDKEAQTATDYREKIAKANKRYSGIVRATKKEFDKSTPQDLNEAEIKDRAMKLLKGIGKVGKYGVRGVWWAINHPVQAIGLAAAVTHPKETYNAANFAWNLVTDPARVATVLSKYGYNSVVPWGNTKQAQQDLNAILGNSATSDMIFKLGGLAVQYALPIAGVIALLYGGKLFADYLNSPSQEEAGKRVFDQIKAELSRDKPDQVKEATKLPAPTRPFGDTELTDYLDRIRNREKKKTDKYKLPYIHRSSVVGYYNEEGKKYNVDAIKDALKERPKKLLKQNEKMQHSNGESEQFYNIGFAALVGIALDEQTNELIVVNTCPGAGSCKIDCFAMKGGKVQFQGPWLSDGRILTYLLNDPDGFFKQLDSEIKKEEKKGDKGGYSVSIRWHDAGDFFSPEYVDMAFKLAENNPDVSFYAYTKVSDVAMGDKPGNFMINWSEGASFGQEKKVKDADPELEKTKNSRIVPSNLFYDLLVKDEKKNLVKGPEGQWQVIPDKLPELKQRLAQHYKLSPSSILSYDEWENKVKGQDKSPLKYNVIITPGEPDLTAKDAGVLSTLLLKH